MTEQLVVGDDGGGSCPALSSFEAVGHFVSVLANFLSHHPMYCHRHHRQGGWSLRLGQFLQMLDDRQDPAVERRGEREREKGGERERERRGL